MNPPSIAVIGSINVDLTTFVDRMPQAGETIFGRSFHLGFGGKGANQAVAAQLCGAQVQMVGRVGDDLFGPAARQALQSYGVDTGLVRTTQGVSTGVAPIFVESSGQNRILVVKGANEQVSPADVNGAGEALRRAQCLILQLEIPVETVAYALRFARNAGIRTILNPAPAQPLSEKALRYADYLIPNESEAATLTGMPVNSIEEAQAASAQLQKMGASSVITTLGANGALFTSHGESKHIPGFPVKAHDTTGAGDAFIGSFAYFLAGGADGEAAIRKANLYAALSTLKVGTQQSFVRREEFEREWTARAIR
jgi:ribokinase